MKTLYIECNMGAAGDMLMGALLELHPEPDAFIAKLNGLDIPKVEVRAEKADKLGIVGTNIRVIVSGEEEISRDYHSEHHHDDNHHHTHDHPHDHDHHHDPEHHHDHDPHHSHDHPHDHDHHHHDYDGDEAVHTHDDLSTLPHVTQIITELPVSDWVKEQAIAIYQRIAQAEAKAHGRDASQVHFHEVGALDAVTDIVGNCLLIEALKPERIIVSPIRVGHGMVRCAHGILPIPAPATAHILQGVPTYAGDIEGEMCTPTGAAILRHFADEFGPMPTMVVQTIGYGLGKKNFKAANLVRIFFGNRATQDVGVTELSCNLDDMTGEDIAYAMEQLLDAGALDVYLIPIQMKKNRPGTMFCVLCASDQADAFAKRMLQHTTSFGIRASSFTRYTLDRAVTTHETTLGSVRQKRGVGYETDKLKYEHDDLVQIAQTYRLSLSDVKQRITKQLMRGGDHE